MEVQLAQEVARLCKQLGLENAAGTKMKNTEYKKEVDKAFRFMDESNMKKEMIRMKDKEMKMMINENCDLKDYVKMVISTLEENPGKARCYMLRVASNFPNHKN